MGQMQAARRMRLETIKLEYTGSSSDNVQARVFDGAVPTAVRILTKYAAPSPLLHLSAEPCTT